MARSIALCTTDEDRRGWAKRMRIFFCFAIAPRVVATVCVCQAGSLAVNSILSAFITASVVLSVGLPLALKDR